MREFQTQAEPNHKKTQGKVKIAPFLAFTLWNFTCFFPSVRLRSCYVSSRVCLFALAFVMVVRVCSISAMVVHVFVRYRLCLCYGSSNVCSFAFALW